MRRDMKQAITHLRPPQATPSQQKSFVERLAWATLNCHEPFPSPQQDRISCLAPKLSRIPDQAWGQVLAFDGDFNEACFSDDYLDINLTAANEDLNIFERDLLKQDQRAGAGALGAAGIP